MGHDCFVIYTSKSEVLVTLESLEASFLDEWFHFGGRDLAHYERRVANRVVTGIKVTPTLVTY